MLANIKIQLWSNKPAFAAMTAEQYVQFTKMIGEPDLTQEQAGETYREPERVMDADEMELLSDLGIVFSVHRVKGLHYNTPHATTRADILGSAQIVNVSVTGPNLLAVQTVTWLEDACTEDLQSALDKGWRIVAVCPPNDSRRPTYVIGHTTAGERL
jgi:hypothetical protein